MEKEYKNVPKSRCYSMEQIIRAVRSASESVGCLLSLAEATEAIDQTYGRSIDDVCEMLFDGSWKGLAEPYSKKWAPKKGVELENKMIDVICDLYNSNWWDQCTGLQENRSNDVGNILILKEDAEKIWGRVWRFLHGDVLLPDLKQFCESSQSVAAGVYDVEKRDGSRSMEAVVLCATANPINSLAYDRLIRAIEAFPSRYPEYSTKPPKLDDDVRPWLKESGLGENDAERRVFGAILREHFRLFPTP